MTLAEYELRMEAHELQKIDQQELFALQFLIERKADALNRKGDKYVNNTIESIYDKEAEVGRVRSVFEPGYETNHSVQIDPKRSRGEVFAKRMAEFKRLKSEGKIVPLSQRKEA